MMQREEGMASSEYGVHSSTDRRRNVYEWVVQPYSYHLRRTFLCVLGLCASQSRYFAHRSRLQRYGVYGCWNSQTVNTRSSQSVYH